MEAYPETASISWVLLRLKSMNVIDTGAPAWGLFPLATSSSPLIFVLFSFVTSISMVTFAGKLN
jgi:hypothetical protein